MKFWDREKEIEDLKRYLQAEPNAILFVYGPKSSGKSTLLMRVAQEMKRDRVKFLWYDLRKYAIKKSRTPYPCFWERRDPQWLWQSSSIYSSPFCR